MWLGLGCLDMWPALTRVLSWARERTLRTRLRVCIRAEKRTAQLFYASPVALLVGSGYDASCSGLKWLETAADCSLVCRNIVLLINLDLGKHEIFSAFHCWENKCPPACWEALLIYSLGCLYCKHAIRRDCLSIKSLFTPKLKGSETVLRLILPE